MCEEIDGMEGEGSNKKTGDEGQTNVREVSRWAGLGLGFWMGLIVLSKKSKRGLKFLGGLIGLVIIYYLCCGPACVDYNH